MIDTILYLDCDGVILNTMETSYKMMKELGLDSRKCEDLDYFFISYIDWNYLIYKSGIINDAILKIRKIKDSNFYKDVKILTKLSGNIDEELIKRRLFLKLLPDIEVITLPFKGNKDEVVNPVGNILVEDNLSNFDRWEKAYGNAILFKQNEFNYDSNIICDLMDIPKTNTVKKLIKTRNL